jgi:threonine/homoserine/homoserine lactone efflux protein
MQHYYLFLLMASATILSPGPGVILTLSNALRYGFRGALGGIVGIACGALVVATLSATSVGLIIASSVLAFTVLKYIGAAYLIYLGIKLWRNPGSRIGDSSSADIGVGRRFLEAISLQLTNPKAIFFFMSIFPQFINGKGSYVVQFSVLVFTYGSLVILIHCMYALMAKRAKAWLNSKRGSNLISKVGGATLMGFGLALASANR